MDAVRYEGGSGGGGRQRKRNHSGVAMIQRTHGVAHVGEHPRASSHSRARLFQRRIGMTEGNRYAESGQLLDGIQRTRQLGREGYQFQVTQCAQPLERFAARLGDGTLAGSIISMLDGVRLMQREVGVPLAEAAVMASTNPAAVLGLRDRGKLVPSCWADLIVLNRALELRAVFVGGRELS